MKGEESPFHSRAHSLRAGLRAKVSGPGRGKTKGTLFPSFSRTQLARANMRMLDF